MDRNYFLFFLILILLTIKLIAINFTNFNLFGDEAQYWIWSQILDFGYFSKPPFLSWVIRFYTGIFQDSFFTLKFLPSIVYFLIATSIYVFLKNLGLKNQEAFGGSLTFLIIPAVSFSSFIISTDLFLLLFWTLSLNELFKIIKFQKTVNFILLGIFLGLCFLSKYAAIYFLICLLIFVLLDKDFRRVFLYNYLKFFLTFLIVFIVLLPNLMWNMSNGWVTLQHTSDNANFENIQLSLMRGIEFLIIQILMLGPFIFLGIFFGFKTKAKTKNFLLVFSIPIISIVFIEAIIVRANANWAAPALISLFVYLYIGLNNNILKNLNYLFNSTLCIIFFIMIGTSYPASLFDRINGLKNYAKSIYINASKNVSENIVISDRLLFSSVYYELRKENINFYMPHTENEKITNHFKITHPLAKNMSKNFIFIGSPKDINYLEKDYKLLKKLSPKQKFTKQKIEVYEVIFE